MSVCAAACCILLIYWASTESSPKPIGAAAVGKADSDQGAVIPEQDQEFTLTKEEAAAKPSDISNERWRRIVRIHRANRSSENGNVAFYGLVVDQSGDPIPDVEIRARLTFYVESLLEQMEQGGQASGSHHLSTSTNSVGHFEFSGYRGRVLYIESFSREGYYISADKLRSFTFGRNPHYIHKGNPSERVVFSMWKVQEAAKLVEHSIKHRFVPDGTPMNFDLVSGRIVEEGSGYADIQLRVRADYSRMTNNQHYSWSITVSSENEGIVEANEAYLFAAPIDGYVSSISWTSSENPEQWKRQISADLYLRSRDETMYGAVDLRVIVFHTNMATVILESAVNLDGSTNLQPLIEDGTNRRHR